ncbi:MAG: hypothetical protein K6G47_07725 [Clostridia bacterium]|nr:hypothetical protein [Clostridia bacterium]
MPEEDEVRKQLNDQLDAIKKATISSRGAYDRDVSSLLSNSKKVNSNSPIVQKAMESIEQMVSDSTVEDNYNYALNTINSYYA